MDAKRFLSRRPHAVPALIAAAMLLGAFGKWPYDYYRLLRWVTCAAAVFVAYQGWAWKRLWATWAFGFVAVLFNPLVPIHLKRQTWQLIDLATAVAFLAGIAALAKPSTVTKHNDEGEEDAPSAKAK